MDFSMISIRMYGLIIIAASAVVMPGLEAVSGVPVSEKFINQLSDANLTAYLKSLPAKGYVAKPQNPAAATLLNNRVQNMPISAPEKDALLAAIEGYVPPKKVEVVVPERKPTEVAHPVVQEVAKPLPTEAPVRGGEVSVQEVEKVQKAAESVVHPEVVVPGEVPTPATTSGSTGVAGQGQEQRAPEGTGAVGAREQEGVPREGAGTGGAGAGAGTGTGGQTSAGATDRELEKRVAQEAARKEEAEAQKKEAQRKAAEQEIEAKKIEEATRKAAQEAEVAKKQEDEAQRKLEEIARDKEEKDKQAAVSPGAESGNVPAAPPLLVEGEGQQAETQPVIPVKPTKKPGKEEAQAPVSVKTIEEENKEAAGLSAEVQQASDETFMKALKALADDVESSLNQYIKLITDVLTSVAKDSAYKKPVALQQLMGAKNVPGTLQAFIKEKLMMSGDQEAFLEATYNDLNGAGSLVKQLVAIGYYCSVSL